MGYGARALQALNAFYSGEYFNLDETTQAEESYPDPSIVDEVRSSSSAKSSVIHAIFFDTVGFLADGQTDDPCGECYASAIATPHGAETGDAGLPWRLLRIDTATSQVSCAKLQSPLAPDTDQCATDFGSVRDMCHCTFVKHKANSPENTRVSWYAVSTHPRRKSFCGSANSQKVCCFIGHSSRTRSP